MTSNGKCQIEMIKEYWLLCIIMIPPLLSTQTSNGNPQPKDVIKRNQQADGEGAGVLTKDEAMKWKTTGFKQANSMGGGEAAISKNGKLRVFVLMGQSNMQGAARAAELKSPYNEKHDRIKESGQMGGGNTFCRAIGSGRACQWRMSLPNSGRTIP